MENLLSSHDGWVSLVEYAQQTGLSLSTLRRQIKSNRIEFRIDKGKYYLRLPEGVVTQSSGSGVHARTEDVSMVTQLRQELQRAYEEVSELKMLVAIYEERLK